MTEAVEYMVQRFLSWKLPENFNPDAGISFNPTFNDHLPVPMKHNPTGTNLFDCTQAKAMVEHMLEGLPTAEALAAKDAQWQPIETAPKDGTRALFYTPGNPYAVIARARLKDSIVTDRWSKNYKGFAHQLPESPYTHWMPLPTPPAIKEKNDVA